jgi:hypothetical protein
MNCASTLPSRVASIRGVCGYGIVASRPRLDQLLRDARLQKVRGREVWKLDRWGRSVAHCVRSIQELVYGREDIMRRWK